MDTQQDVRKTPRQDHDATLFARMRGQLSLLEGQRFHDRFAETADESRLGRSVWDEHHGYASPEINLAIERRRAGKSSKCGGLAVEAGAIMNIRLLLTRTVQR